jgi:hypothetical protein
LPVVFVLTFLEGLDDAAGFAAPQSGTMMHPIAKSNVRAYARETIQEEAGDEEEEDAEERVRFCISGEVVAPICGVEWRHH